MSQVVKNLFRFEELNVYQDSINLANTIYYITKRFPKDEMFGLINQFRRAGTSISLNIAEGSSRSKKDFVHFLNLAKGSCFECVAIIQISLNQGYLSQNEFNELYEKLNKLSRMLSKLQSSLRSANNE